MKYFSPKKQLIATIMLALFSLLYCDRDSSPWIWKIDDKKVTVNQLDQAYDHFLYLMSQKIRIDISELKKLIKNPKNAPAQLQQYLPGLTKRSYVDQYKRMLLLNLQAKKDNYLDKKETKDMINFLTKYYIVDNYVRSKINPGSITISDEQVLAEWEKIRNSDPRYKQVPIDQGMQLVKQQMLLQEVARAHKEFLENITGNYIIEANPDYLVVTYIGEPENTEGRRDKWVWKIEGNQVTAGEIDDGYHSFLRMMAQQFQSSVEKLKKYAQNPETAPAEVKPYIKGLTKEAFAKQYKELTLTFIEAEKQGYVGKDETKSQIKFINDFYTANLYMMEKIQPDTIQVTDQETLKKWKQLQKESPSFRNVPRSQGLPIIKRQIRMEKLTIRNADLMQQILESSRIEVNPDFDLRKYTSPAQEKAPEKKEEN